MVNVISQSKDFDIVLLKDKSIVRIYSDGIVFLFPNLKFWKKPSKKAENGNGRFHLFQFKSKEQAKEIVTLLDELS